MWLLLQVRRSNLWSVVALLGVAAASVLLAYAKVHGYQ